MGISVQKEFYEIGKRNHRTSFRNYFLFLFFLISELKGIIGHISVVVNNEGSPDFFFWERDCSNEFTIKSMYELSRYLNLMVAVLKQLMNLSGTM